nr:hypothetical protein [uncultured bacterium]
MDIRKHLLLSISISLIAACPSISNAKDDAKPINAINFDVNYYDKNNSILIKPKNKDIAISFAPIRGAIFGGANFKYAAILLLKEDEFIEIPISDFTVFFKRHATTFIPKSEKLKVTPSTTKIIRLGTRVTHQGSDKGLGHTVFVNNANKQSLMLVYFSNACQITGTLVDNNLIYNHNISIPKKGAYWITANQINDNTYTLKTSQEKLKLSFGIFPN